MIGKKIRIIKEYNNLKDNTIIFTVRTELYDDSAQYWLDLVEIARQDFPDLKFDDVKTFIYGGQVYKKTRGIEFVFDIPLEAIPDGYVDGIRLEYVM